MAPTKNEILESEECIRTHDGWRRGNSFFYDRQPFYDFDAYPKELPDYDSESPHCKAMYVCVYDDKAKLLDLIPNIPEDHMECFWYEMFEYDALQCATAILDGETKGALEFPTSFELFGDYPPATPLEQAARFGSHKLTKLFLSRGVGPGANHKNVNNELPLNIALDERVSEILWSPKQSLFCLLSWLCHVTERDSLETVRILVQHMTETEV